MNSERHNCTNACYAMPKCMVCGLTKPPRGRSVPLEAANGYCGYDCSGYAQEPRSGHLWPSEKPIDDPVTTSLVAHHCSVCGKDFATAEAYLGASCVNYNSHCE